MVSCYRSTEATVKSDNEQQNTLNSSRCLRVSVETVKANENVCPTILTGVFMHRRFVLAPERTN
ncbi:hypothetical protein A0J61_00793 [Choanephora cucurbitarum]|uniref:Uncharacterized protein n=1 Tax=Choanephora cucurbitarum TaxID=101091 RepID=A0A1C7NPW2_9FUNG|nr:hypothetical protein A0J61_00793 [Choanephora cucurbitarum]